MLYFFVLVVGMKNIIVVKFCKEVKCLIFSYLIDVYWINLDEDNLNVF